MTTCVLGGAGFVGSHLVDMLTSGEERVIVFDDYSHPINYRNKYAEYYTYNVANISEVRAGFLRFEVDIVYNLAAAVAGIYHNIDHQLFMYASNINVLTNPLLAAAHAGVKKFLQVSSVCVYDPGYQEDRGGVLEKFGLEGTPQPANAGYAEAKRDGERAALWESNIPHVVIVRPSNIVGPRDHFDDRAHVIPALIKRVVHDDVLRVYGNPGYSREFIHVEDVALGMISALTHGKHKETYNIGSGEVITIEALARLIVSIHADKTGEHKNIEWAGGEGGDPYRLSNCDKINKLGWKAERSIKEAVYDTYNYYERS